MQRKRKCACLSRISVKGNLTASYKDIERGFLYPAIISGVAVVEWLQHRERSAKMKKYLMAISLVFMALIARADLYSYSSRGSETIDGVTWGYCISNNTARIIDRANLEVDNNYVLDRKWSYWKDLLRRSVPNAAYFNVEASTSEGLHYTANGQYWSYYPKFCAAINPNVSGAVAVPSTLGGCPVVAIDAYAFGYCTKLTHVTIPEGVKEIGPGAFYHCTGLVTVVVPQSIEKIDTCAFDGCTALASISIPSSVEKIGDYAFRNCSGMTMVDVAYGVTTIDYRAFQDCHSIERIVLPSSVRTINGYAFTGCINASSVMLSHGIEEIGSYAFNCCRSLTSITIPSSVTHISDHAFYGCSALKKAIINANITSLPNDMFWGCSQLQKVTMPDSITEIGSSIFRECHALSDINIPAGVTTIGDHAFYNCRSLVDFIIPEGITRINDETFNGCTALIGIDLPVGLLSIGSYAFYNCTSLTHLDIPDTVTIINANAFVGCSGLERIVVPGSVSTMASGAFNCANATIVFTGDVPSYSVTDAGFLNSKAISYPRQYGANWLKLLGSEKFGGYTETQIGLPEVVIVSASMRPNDPTILDVVYRINCVDDTVSVRALAFEDGVRSFAKVIRPETFVDGTAANVADGVQANVEHTISWRVSADWSTDLAKMKFEVLAMRETYIPMELITIPAIEGHDAMTISWSTVSPAQIVNAMYWLYASKDDGLEVENGVIKDKSSDVEYVNGSTLMNSGDALKFIYARMGYSELSGDDLDYARSATRLPLVVDVSRPFAKKND